MSIAPHTWSPERFNAVRGGIGYVAAWLTMLLGVALIITPFTGEGDFLKTLGESKNEFLKDLIVGFVASVAITTAAIVTEE